MKTIYYRLANDRKFFSTNENDVINYAVRKHKLTDNQKNELINFGTTQDEKVSLIQFCSI